MIKINLIYYNNTQLSIVIVTIYESDIDLICFSSCAPAEYDYLFQYGSYVFSVNRPEINFDLAIYNDGIAEDVEGLILFLEVIESQLDPRDVGQVQLTRSAYLITISQSGMCM